MSDPLDFLVFVGTVRESGAPYPARLGLRVAEGAAALLADEGHRAQLVDPLKLDIPRPFRPHFSYARGRAPDDLEMLAGRIAEADGYVMVSPEYNHSMSPALADLLNHFGASKFAFRPSAIVTYSAGQWGGVRAAVQMRTFLSELGCLPVSAMVHVPAAQDVFREDGTFRSEVDAERWRGYFRRTFDQLAWWAGAARRQRTEGEDRLTPAFEVDPSQRNAP